MAYFRSYNDSDTKQIDDDSVFLFQYREPVVVVNDVDVSVWNLNAPFLVNPYIIGRDVVITGVPQSMDVTISFEGVVTCWGWIHSRSSNSITVRLYVTFFELGEITIRVWGNRIPNLNTKYGFRLRDGTVDNNIIYDSGAKPMRPLGDITPAGYSGINYTGRDVAFVPQNWGVGGSLTPVWGDYGSCSEGGAVLGYALYELTSSSYHMLSAHKDQVEMVINNWSSNLVFRGCFTNWFPSSSSAYSSLGTTKALLIDVTNY